LIFAASALIDVTPGMVLTPVNRVERGRFSVNGQRPDPNYFTVDGVSANFGVTGYVEMVLSATRSPLFGQSTQRLASGLGSRGASGGCKLLCQIGGPRLIQLALRLQF